MVGSVWTESSQQAVQPVCCVTLPFGHYYQLLYVVPYMYVGGGVGKIFVEFTDVEGATKARSVVAGRTFNGNLVGAEYYPEGLFMKKVRYYRQHV